MMMSMTATNAAFDCILGLQSPHQVPKHHCQYRCNKEDNYLTNKISAIYQIKLFNKYFENLLFFIVYQKSFIANGL